MNYDDIYQKLDKGAKIILAGVTHKQISCAKFFTEEFMKELAKRKVKYLFTELDPNRVINGQLKQKYFDKWNHSNIEPEFASRIIDLVPIWRSARKAGLEIRCIDRKLEVLKSLSTNGYKLTRDELMCEEILKYLKPGLKAIYVVGYQHIKTTKESIKIPMIADEKFSSITHYVEPEPLGYRLVLKLGASKVISFKVR